MGGPCLSWPSRKSWGSTACPCTGQAGGRSQAQSPGLIRNLAGLSHRPHPQPRFQAIPPGHLCPSLQVWPGCLGQKMQEKPSTQGRQQSGALGREHCNPVVEAWSTHSRGSAYRRSSRLSGTQPQGRALGRSWQRDVLPGVAALDLEPLCSPCSWHTAAQLGPRVGPKTESPPRTKKCGSLPQLPPQPAHPTWALSAYHYPNPDMCLSSEGLLSLRE